MSTTPMLIQVALPVPLYQLFDYLPRQQVHPQGGTSHGINNTKGQLPQIGSRVRVPFGRQSLIGIVVAHQPLANSSVPQHKLKTISQTFADGQDTADDNLGDNLGNSVLVDTDLMALARWLARYYHYPLGEVLMVMLPTLIRQGKPLDIFISHWRIRANATVDALPANAHKQRQQLSILARHGNKGASEDVLMLEGMQRSYLLTLQKKGLVEHDTSPKSASPPVQLAKLPLTLSQEQQHALDMINSAFDAGSYAGILLDGVTGSGKTEVYLQAMHPVLEAGKQVLILVPEIGLTPQSKARFSSRFAAHIVLLHSGMSNSQRLQGWQDCRSGHAQIIIGTRSAVLYPFANLGLIIVDEAHDGSYKQQDSLRYHATDVALYRGYQHGIAVVLGTATPSLEQLKLVTDGKLDHCRLSKRAGKAQPVQIQLIDARQGRHYRQTQSDGNEYDTGLSIDLVDAIRHTLAAGEQVLVFLNRRGYAPILLCAACGWQADCPRCDAHLTVHKSQHPTSAYLKCHHCDWQQSLPTQCPDCGSHNLDSVGMGTSRLTESLHAIFANPQTSKHPYPIIQIDKDTTRRKGSWERLYQRINQGDPAILVGTQMLAKGHHFPNVTLVAMPNADRGFLSADFRAPEHTAQLMIQVAGRAGRANKPGRVLIQTQQPDNALLLKLVKDGYAAFTRDLLSQRRLMGLPPYTHAALIRCEGKTPTQPHTVLNDAIHALPLPHPLAVLGPIDAPISKKNNRYHAQLLLLGKQRRDLHLLLANWWPQVLTLPSVKSVKITLDIDPLGW